jgi:ABC-type uncharacterized transport system permease subunit
MVRWMVINVAIQAVEVLGVVGFGLAARPPRYLWVSLALGLVVGSALGLQLAVLAITRAAR